MDSLPAAALGHFVMKVANLGASYQFYADLGLRQIGIFPDVAIIELRGGTHILLVPETDEAPFTLTSSRLGQRAAFFNEHLDLMINGKTRGELEAYRAILLKNGIAAGEIAPERFFGHDYFHAGRPGWSRHYALHEPRGRIARIGHVVQLDLDEPTPDFEAGVSFRWSEPLSFWERWRLTSSGATRGPW